MPSIGARNWWSSQVLAWLPGRAISSLMENSQTEIMLANFSAVLSRMISLASMDGLAVRHDGDRGDCGACHDNVSGAQPIW
jgi:hypothetical protein